MGRETARSETTGWAGARLLAETLRQSAPAILFGLRLWASACLALYLAFWLELPNPYWAATTAAVVCQPKLGASLRKASYRLTGTVIGAVAIVILTACFPQDRAGFLLGLAVWGAACGLTATLLRNFAAYAAALAGYTAAIIASNVLGATGAPSGDVFMLAVFRASEICIGIVSAGTVLALTDLGGARRRLAGEFAALTAAISARFAAAFAIAGPDQSQTRSIRRELFRRVIALDPLIDTAIGEASDLRYRSRVLQTAVGGLFAALSAWRMIALHLERLPLDEGRHEAEIIRHQIPRELLSAPGGEASLWLRNPAALRQACLTAARSLTALPVATPSLQLLADGAAEAMLGLARALNGLALIVDPERAASGQRDAFRLNVPDWLPAIINATRVFLTIGAVILFWIVTAWPSGATAITFAAIIAILLSPQADQAFRAAIMFLIGASASAVLAVVVKFLLLPGNVTFAGLCAAIGLVLVPFGSLVALPWRPAVFTAAAVNFIPLLAPTNEMTYDGQQFFNSALAIMAGIATATIAMRLLPPLSPATRTRRLLSRTLGDLRRLAARARPWTRGDWENRVYGASPGATGGGGAVAACAAWRRAFGRRSDHPASRHRAPFRHWREHDRGVRRHCAGSKRRGGQTPCRTRHRIRRCGERQPAGLAPRPRNHSRPV